MPYRICNIYTYIYIRMYTYIIYIIVYIYMFQPLCQTDTVQACRDSLYIDSTLTVTRDRLENTLRFAHKHTPHGTHMFTESVFIRCTKILCCVASQDTVRSHLLHEVQFATGLQALGHQRLKKPGAKAVWDACSGSSI